MNNKIVIAITLTFVIFAAGCVSKEPESKDRISDGPDFQAKSKCEAVCQQKLNANQSLSDGPCLSNEIAADWVCDVAHNPRQAIDDLPENQCNAYREGRAHHFVEIDENCNLIRAI